MKKIDLKIWVIHYTKLINRKQHLKPILDNLGFKYTFIEVYDKEDLNQIDLKKFSLNMQKQLNVLSLFKKHIYTFQEILNSEYKYNLIFEDDVILNKHFTIYLEKALTQLPDNFDMLFIGDGCNIHIHPTFIEKDKYIYKKDVKPNKIGKKWGGIGSVKCTDSFLINKKTCLKLLDYYNKNIVYNPIDHWLNTVNIDLNLNIYWMEPTIVSQGSQNGVYKSSLELFRWDL